MKLPVLAVWDFEALHDGVMATEYGPNWFKQPRSSHPATVISVPEVTKYVTKNWGSPWQQAYADWRYFQPYVKPFFDDGVSLTQLFPIKEGTRNNFPDQLERLLNESPIIDCVGRLVIIGATPGIAPLLRHPRLADISVVAITAPGSDEGPLRAVSDEQVAFADSVQPIREAPRHPPHRNRPGASAYPAQAANNTNEHRGGPSPNLTDTEKRRRNRVMMYQRISAQQGLRLPHPEVMWVGVDIYANFLHAPEGFEGFKSLDEECLQQLRRDFPTATMTDAKKIRQVLFKCFLFSPSTEDRIGFREDIENLRQVEDLYYTLIVNRIALKAPQPVDFEALSLAVTGELNSSRFLEEKFMELQP